MANYRALFYVVTSRYLLRLTALPVFLICHIRSKIGLPCTFSSRSVTSGNHEQAFQALQWHFLLFLICHIRMKNGLPRTFSSRSVTSGNRQWALTGNVMELSRGKHHHVQDHRRNTDPAHPPDRRTTQQRQKESLSLQT